MNEPKEGKCKKHQNFTPYIYVDLTEMLPVRIKKTPKHLYIHTVKSSNPGKLVMGKGLGGNGRAARRRAFPRRPPLPTSRKSPWPCPPNRSISRVIEAGCKTVIGSRCERFGMFWGEPGAEKVLALRSIRSSRRLHEFWKHRLNSCTAQNDALTLTA